MTNIKKSIDDELEILNLTPHAITLQRGTITTGYYPYLKEGLRISIEEQKFLYKLEGNDVFSSPDFSKGKLDFSQIDERIEKADYITVSMPVGEYLKTHKEILKNVKVIGLDTGSSCIRKKGQIVAVTRFIHYR